MKTVLTTPSGHQVMTIDCDKYVVEIFKSSLSDKTSSPIKYTDKKTGTTKVIPGAFKIDWDEEKDGGKIELRYRDRWGSEMNFIHYYPSDLKGMFDFIGKGYNIFDNGFAIN